MRRRTRAGRGARGSLRGMMRRRARGSAALSRIGMLLGHGSVLILAHRTVSGTFLASGRGIAAFIRALAVLRAFAVIRTITIVRTSALVRTIAIVRASALVRTVTVVRTIAVVASAGMTTITAVRMMTMSVVSIRTGGAVAVSS